MNRYLEVIVSAYVNSFQEKVNMFFSKTDIIILKTSYKRDGGLNICYIEYEKTGVKLP